jgi:hypothetical protein
VATEEDSTEREDDQSHEVSENDDDNFVGKNDVKNAPIGRNAKMACDVNRFDIYAANVNGDVNKQSGVLQKPVKAMKINEKVTSALFDSCTI